MTLLLTILLSCGSLGQTGAIAYITGEIQADYQLTVVDCATGETKPVGQGQHDAYPRWSPDGSRIAYQSKQPEGIGIRVACPDSGADTAIPHQFNWNYQPRWSSDGRRIAYSTDGDAAPLQAIAVYDFDTNEETIWGGTHRGLMRPVWLPSTDLMLALDPDDQVAAEALGLMELSAEAETHGVITAIGLGGAPPDITVEVFILTPSLAIPLLPFLVPDSHRYVEWSVEPDHRGRQIAYESNDGGNREIFVLGRRGITNISNHPAANWNPVWSPDNNWMAFESFRDGRRGVYRVLVSTANVFPVAVGDQYDCWSPDWSPDGNHIVFVSDQKGLPQLFTIGWDGTDQKQITDGPHPAFAPTWRPSP